ncbi:Outer membrane protein assembly factor BamD [Candidatus Methylobacter favarea]|uniref:Outer membrane protein assembly factor BamD n=1 Tax=Candidatus Methylobacter favarea TaxID=2707345 RepID=A0A8S0YA58_9GAMM|nr:outer membrane protein assembly factor BamD [Candidatus Methylobacter favarea]CAA9891151.1 Outer membrane protein assembly factor BamD [Candidatus Methylobacter favarea]
MRLILIKFLFICCLGWSLQGCETLKNFVSSDTDTEDEYVDWNSEKFRQEAKKAVEAGSYEKAIKLYEALESRYPFGEESAQTQLDIAYAYYKNNDPDSAIAAADRFIKINPRNPSVDYAYYLKGLVNYNRGIGFIDRFLPTDISQRDPGSARDALENFADLIRRFPESKYVADARQRMIALKNNLAMHEVHVARFYMKRKAYIAAANRASNVVEKYQRTPAVPFALQIMQEAYTKLDLPELSKDVAKIYELNYPNGPPVPEHKNSTVSHQVWDFIGLEK